MHKQPIPQTEQKVSRKTFKKIPGQQDFLPEDFADVEMVSNQLAALAAGFGFTRVEPSFFEAAEVIDKFKHIDRRPVLFYNEESNSRAVVRPTVLPGLLRMYVESRVREKESFSKWYYLAPVVVEKNNPYQLISNTEYGFEILGDDSAVADAQVLALAWKLYSGLGQDSVVLEIGSRGCDNCWPIYQETLVRSLADAKYSLCKDCAMGLEANPERVLTCLQPECQSIAGDAPAFIDYLDSTCSAHLTLILESLDELGVPYVVLPNIEGHKHIRRTVFRFKFNHPQDNFILSQGNRHDGLFALLDHEPIPALGLMGDLSNLVRAWRLSGLSAGNKKKVDVILIPLGDLACKKSLSLFSQLWDSGIAVMSLMGENSLKARLAQALEMRVPLALVIGQKEALDDTVILRDVRSGMQEVFTKERILSEVKKRLGE